MGSHVFPHLLIISHLITKELKAESWEQPFLRIPPPLSVPRQKMAADGEETPNPHKRGDCRVLCLLSAGTAAQSRMRGLRVLQHPCAGLIACGCPPAQGRREARSLSSVLVVEGRVSQMAEPDANNQANSAGETACYRSLMAVVQPP